MKQWMAIMIPIIVLLYIFHYRREITSHTRYVQLIRHRMSREMNSGIDGILLLKSVKTMVGYMTC